MSASDTIAQYATSQTASLEAICNLLRKQIDGALPKATSKIYYAMPVWFVGESPVVGYKAAGKHVMLLFWNGQAFGDTALAPAGKFKAAKITYRSVAEIDAKSLRQWLRKAGTLIWDIRTLRKPPRKRGA